MNALILFAIAVSFFLKCSGEIPSDIEKCHSGDVLCIARTTTDILHRYPHGNKYLALPNIEPIHLDELVVAKKHADKPLALDLKFTNLDVYGLSQTNVTRVIGFGKDPRKSKYEMHTNVPLLTLRGQYETNGRILLLPIVGNGTAEVKLKNFKNGVKLKLSIVDENGKQRVAISKMKVQTEPESMTVRLDNLFNGNKVLGDEINNVLNNNWKDVWSELESGINEGFAEIVKLLTDDILKAISYDEFFTD